MISHDLSLITMATGPRGSLKTLLMTSDMCYHLERAYYQNKYRGRNIKIFSNYPVGFWKVPIGETQRHYFKPEPLNMEALYIFDKELSDCQVYIDEIDQWMDRQEWQSVTQRLINKVTQLIRKRKMSLHGTIQSFDWLNNRLQFQTDLIIRCREAAFSPWGKANHLRLGEMAFLTWYDNSGFMTGYTHKERPDIAIREDMFREGHRYWNSYDTSFEFDPLTTSTKYRLKLPVKEIVVGAAASVGREINPSVNREMVGNQFTNKQSIAPSTPYILNGDKKNAIESAASHAVFQFKERGGDLLIPDTEMYQSISQQLGIEVSRRLMGSALATLGVRRSSDGRHFNLQPPIDLGDRQQKEKAEAALEHLFDPTNHPGVRELAGVS